jgi:Domain of unknown function (DUF4911)
MKQIDHYIKVPKNEVAFISVYLEAFEGMCAVRTPNPKPGEDTILHIMLSPDFVEQYDELMAGLQKEIPMEEVEP